MRKAGMLSRQSSAPSNNKQTTLLFLKQVSEKPKSMTERHCFRIMAAAVENFPRANLDHSVAV